MVTTPHRRNNICKTEFEKVKTCQELPLRGQNQDNWASSFDKLNKHSEERHAASSNIPLSGEHLSYFACSFFASLGV